MKRSISLTLIVLLLGACQSEHSVEKATVFLPGLVSTDNQDENYISFDAAGETLFFTRGTDWARQIPYVAYRKDGTWGAPERIQMLDTIYNGAISPSGQQILYSIRKDEIDRSEIWMMKKRNGKWADTRNLTYKSDIQGGYFHWYSETEIYMYEPVNEGDLIQVKWENDTFSLVKRWDQFNTTKGCEFSPFMGPEKRFFIFTRYLEGDSTQQGFFISYNQGDKAHPIWQKEEKIQALPYAWGARFSRDLKQFFYTDGVDIFVRPASALGIQID